MASNPPKTTSKAKAPITTTKVEKSASIAVAPKAPAKPKKPKLIRDSFTFPKQEYEQIAALKARAEKLGHPIKKSELLRAGVMALSRQKDPGFLQSLKAVPALKTGRPSKT